VFLSWKVTWETNCHFAKMWKFVMMIHEYIIGRPLLFKTGCHKLWRTSTDLLYILSSGGTRWRSCLRHYATSRKVAISIPDKVIGFFSWPSPSRHIMALVSTQPLTEMSTRNLPGGQGRPARKADNLTAICEPTLENMGARSFTTLWTSTACYRDSFT
jgi:hypothetical protein